MKKPLVLALVLGLVLLSCSPQNPLSQLIPGDAFLVAQIEQPKNMLASLELFLKPLDLTQGKSLSDLIKEQQKNLPIGLDVLDFDQPWGMALVPTSTKNPGVLIGIPVKDLAKNLDAIKSFVETKLQMNLATAGNYVVLYKGLDKLPTLPLGQGAFDFSKIQPPNRDGVSLYVNLKSIEKTYLPEGKTLTELMSGSLDQTETALSGKELQFTKELVNQIGKVAEEVEGLTFSLSADLQGIHFWTKSDLKKGGTVMATLTGLKGVKGTKEWEKYLSTKALLTLGANVPPAAMKDFSLKFSDFLWKAYEVPEESVKAYDQQMGSLLDLMGNRSAFNLDLDFDFQKIGQVMASKDFKADSLKDLFDLKFFGAFEVKDGAAYQQAAKSFYASQALAEIYDLILQKGKLPMKFGISLEDRPADAAFKYSAMNFKVELQPGSYAGTKLDAKTAASINSILSAVLNQFQVLFHYEPQKVYYFSGKSALDSLKNLVKKDAVDSNWKDSPEIQGWDKSLPDDSIVTGDFSLSRLLTLLRQTGMDQTADLPDLGNGPGLVGYAKVQEDGNLEAGEYWGLPEIQKVSKEAQKILPEMLNH